MVATNLICFPKCFFGRIFVIAHRSAQKSGGRSEEVFFVMIKKIAAEKNIKTFFKRVRRETGQDEEVEAGSREGQR